MGWLGLSRAIRNHRYNTFFFYFGTIRKFLGILRCKQKKYFVKYEVVCSIGKPRIIWFDGPWKVTVPDCTISQWSQLRVALSGNERLLADKGYINAPNYFICPVTGKSWTLNSEDKTRNYMIYCARQTVERFFSRIKKFGFWHIPWRASIGLHGLCARVTAKLVNFYFLFKPL